MAEVIKTALLGDRLLFEDLERAAAIAAGDLRLAWTVRVCCGIKARLVEADERERADSRRAGRSSTWATPSAMPSSR
jgi:3-dehydroquinate synthetase